MGLRIVGHVFDAICLLLGLSVVGLAIYGIVQGEPIAAFGIGIGLVFVAYGIRDYVERGELASGISPVRFSGFLLSASLLVGAAALLFSGSLVAGLVVLVIALALGAMRAFAIRMQLRLRVPPPVESGS